MRAAQSTRTYLDELKSGYDGQFLDALIEERRRRMVREIARQPMDDALRFSRPIGRRESKTVIGPSVHRVHLIQVIYMNKYNAKIYNT